MSKVVNVPEKDLAFAIGKACYADSHRSKKLHNVKENR